MKKLLSSLLVLTLSLNSTVGYCENADIETQTFSTKIDDNAKTNSNPSHSNPENSNSEFEDADKTKSLMSYLNTKVEEKKNNQIAEHKKELQLLQNMNTKQYITYKLKKFILTTSIFLAIGSAVTVPWFIYVTKKSNELILQAKQAAFNEYFESSDLLKSIKTFLDKIINDFGDNESIVAQILVGASHKLLNDIYTFNQSKKN